VGVRILIACDKFKGSLSAGAACEAVRKGLASSGLGAEADLCPIADGGEGFAEAMITAMQGRWVTCGAHDALGRPITARYGLCRDGNEVLAVMEMAEASGFLRVGEHEQDVMRASTAGTGQMIRHAAQVSRADRILVGIGGSATNDGGVGMAAALGVAFLDGSGTELEPLPAELGALTGICEGGRVLLPPIEVACDVANPLLGAKGATAVYGPQKGAGDKERKRLEAFLERVVEVAEAGSEADLPGAGAAGGLGFGLVRFAGATLRAGFDMVAEALKLAERVAAADVIITGEGSLDAQSLHGKGPCGVARMARVAGRRVIGCGGRVTAEVRNSGAFDGLVSLEDFGLPVEESMRRGAELLEAKGAEFVGLIAS
jgi:glycerate kinase